MTLSVCRKPEQGFSAWRLFTPKAHSYKTSAAALSVLFASVPFYMPAAYLTNSPSDIRIDSFSQPATAWTDDGTFHLVTSGLVYQTWRTNVWITNASPGTGWSPLLEKGPGDSLHLLYKANATNLMYCRKLSNGDWSAPVVAVNIPTSSWVTINPYVTDYNYSHDMAVDENGTVHVLWDESYGFMSGTPTDNWGNSNVSFKVFYTASSDPTNPSSWPTSPIYDFGKRTDYVAGHDPNQHRRYRRNPFAITATNGVIWTFIYATVPTYAGRWSCCTSANGTVWATNLTAYGGHHSSSCDIEPDGKGHMIVFYAVPPVRFKFYDGTNWSNEQTITNSYTSVYGLGAQHDHEGSIWLTFARAWAGAGDPQASGYHWPHSYIGNTSGFSMVDTNQFSQHKIILYGVRPRMAVDDIWPDPGRVWWTFDNITTPYDGRIRGVTLTGLFAGKPPSGTVILLK